MSTSSSVLSQTLQSITTIKLRELEKKKAFFAARKAQILASAEAAADASGKIQILLEGLAKIQGSNTKKNLEDFGDNELDEVLGSLSLSNIRHFLRQSKYDPSIPPTLLPGLEKDLRRILDQKAEKFEYADLYSRLLKEWLKSDATAAADKSADESPVDEGEGFEFVEKQKERLKQLSEKFESVVFTPHDVDVDAIDKLLKGLFVTEEAEKALSRLRKRIRTFGDRLSANPAPFDLDVLEWCITGLLRSDLLSDQNKNTLEGFLKDDVVLTEIADVLNMRFVDLENWTWDAEDGIPVEPRRQLNGKYRVVMDEDILQSVFLHYIGTIWSVEFKASLMDIVKDREVWQRTETMPRDELEKREYYLGRGRVFPNDDVSFIRQDTYENDFFMCQLPSSVDAGAGGYDDEGPDFAKQRQAAAGASIKQQLLRTIGTEVLVNRSLNSQVAVVQSDLQWFATSTSHATVDAILSFYGVPMVWRSFFQRYLAAPLRMVGLEGEQGAIRTRKRGVPITHIFQKLFGELIVFSMDLAVNQEGAMLLYRLHDDLWLCGEPAQCAKGWRAMERCAKTMGVEFNQTKTGSVYITDKSIAKDAEIVATLPKGRVVLGFLELQAETGNWVIDQEQVDAHVSQLRKQLAECKSIFAWVQTWNSCIGRFFNYTFGQPANCFGRGHVDMILETHRRIQHDLFGDKNNDNDDGSSSSINSGVTEHLKTLITTRFNITNICDAFLYFPEEMGGLGLRNPFIPFLVVRDQVLESPTGRMADFFKAEHRSYRHARKDFDNLTERERSHRLDAILGKDSDRHHPPSTAAPATANPNKATWPGPSNGTKAFLPFADYIRHRLSSSSELRLAYDALLATPWTHDVDAARPTADALAKMATSQPEVAWGELGSERRWVVELYAREVAERFGGLGLVERTVLPMGVMKVVKGRKVAWEGGL